MDELITVIDEELEIGADVVARGVGETIAASDHACDCHGVDGIGLAVVAASVPLPCREVGGDLDDALANFEQRPGQR